jgi:CSLREA domain-containing protein
VKEHGLFRLVIGSALLFAAALTLWAATGVDTTLQAPFPEIIVVNSTGDGDDAFPGDGQCETAVGNGVCTLRAAIEEANAHAGTDGIYFSIPSSDPGYSNGTWTIRPKTALPNVADSVNISGPGASQLVVFPYYTSYRCFKVTTTGTVTFSGLKMYEGVVQNDFGGGVYNASTGTVNINNCILSNNESFGSSAGGGAVYNATTGTVNINNSLITRSYVQNQGGAIYNNTGTVTISNSTLTENYTGHPPSGYSSARGGAVFSYLGSLNVVNSTFSYNTSGDGGAIYSSGSTTTISGSTLNANFADTSGLEQGGGGIFIEGGTTNVVNSTLSGNGVLTFYGGGGGAILADGGTLNLTNSTVANNSVFGRETEGGGGVLSYARVNVKSTIIASNSAQGSPGYSPTGPGPDVQGIVSSSGFNLIGKKDGSTGFTLATDRKGTVASPLNPKLDPKGLRSNGGPTQTIALVSGSPAIDKGTSAGLTGTLTTDQRGFARTVDNSGIANPTGGDGTDIGAYEFGAQ